MIYIEFIERDRFMPIEIFRALGDQSAWTDPDDALKMQKIVVYVGNPNLTLGLIPWLDNNETVMRLGSDRQNMQARMCDVAVWTAHLLNIALPFETTHLRNFTPDEIESTRKIFERMAV